MFTVNVILLFMAQGPIMHSGVIKCRCEVIVQLKVLG